MPKMKTHTGAKQRFKVTATGRIRRRRKKLQRSSTPAREYRREAAVTGGDYKKVKRLLGL